MLREEEAEYILTIPKATPYASNPELFLAHSGKILASCLQRCYKKQIKQKKKSVFCKIIPPALLNMPFREEWWYEIIQKDVLMNYDARSMTLQLTVNNEVQERERLYWQAIDGLKRYFVLYDIGIT